MRPTQAEILMHTTVRLECKLSSGEISTGTGFFFGFNTDDETIHAPVIVTNKHVIKDSIIGRFSITKSDSNSLPLVGQIVPIELDNFEARWILHPNPQIDLAILPLASIIHEARDKGDSLYIPQLMEGLIPTGQDLNNLTGLESIIMVGYPNGLWDKKNNLPIVRRGTTATNPKHDYDGEPIFMIDCACFPGSSGSPVMIFEQGNYIDSTGNMIVGNRLLLLGVLFAGPQITIEGQIYTVDTPFKRIPISRSNVPMNLGLVIKSQQLQFFKV